MRTLFLGANDGISGSTTYWCEQLGWKGICIEPLPSMYKVLSSKRKCTCYNVAISNQSADNVDFIEFPGQETRSGLCSTYEQERIRQNGSAIALRHIKVKTSTLNDILEKHPTVKHIDFLSIDTEGHEMQVLQSMDFNRYTCSLISVEADDPYETTEYLRQYHYEMFLRCGSDLMFRQRKP